MAERDDRGGRRKGPRRVIGWLLDPGVRQDLLQRIAPAYGEVVAHHVTLKSGAAPGEQAPEADAPQVVGLADDGEGVQALVVSIGGTPDRPGGGTYHITWSLGPGRRAVESNDVIAARGWSPLPSIPIRLEPADF